MPGGLPLDVFPSANPFSERLKMSRLFDPVDAQNLLDAQMAAMDTRRVPLPQGETTAQILEISFDGGISNKNGKPWNRMNAKLEITDPEYVSQYPGGADKLTTTLGLMVDMDNGRLAVGPNKNIRLGRLREAAGVNGKPLSMLQGQFIRIAIGHKPDSKDPEIIRDEIIAYTKV